MNTTFSKAIGLDITSEDCHEVHLLRSTLEMGLNAVAKTSQDDTIKYLKKWAQSLKACTDIVKGGALYQKHDTQIRLQAELDTYKVFISKFNRMLGLEPLLEQEWIEKYVKSDNKLTAEERLIAREKHKEYFRTFKPLL